MYEVPLAMLNDRVYFRCYVVVSLRWPCPNPNDAHPFNFIIVGERRGKDLWDSCKQCNIDSIAYKTTSHFMNMRFDTTNIAEVAWRYHQHSQCFCFLGHYCGAFRVL